MKLAKSRIVINWGWNDPELITIIRWLETSKELLYPLEQPCDIEAARDTKEKTYKDNNNQTYISLTWMEKHSPSHATRQPISYYDDATTLADYLKEIRKACMAKLNPPKRSKGIKQDETISYLECYMKIEGLK
jgi:hypothetical protein